MQRGEKKGMGWKLGALTGAAAATLPAFAYAAPVFSSFDDVTKFMCTIMNWLFTGAMIFGVIFVLVAALNYVTSGGNTEKLQKAQKTLLYAIIGIAVAVVARGVPFIIGSVLGASVSDACK